MPIIDVLHASLNSVLLSILILSSTKLSDIQRNELSEVPLKQADEKQ